MILQQCYVICTVLHMKLNDTVICGRAVVIRLVLQGVPFTCEQIRQRKKLTAPSSQALRPRLLLQVVKKNDCKCSEFNTLAQYSFQWSIFLYKTRTYQNVSILQQNFVLLSNSYCLLHDFLPHPASFKAFIIPNTRWALDVWQPTKQRTACCRNSGSRTDCAADTLSRISY